ncbi:MAG: DUF3859 domain-containing protein [Marinilabiliaceae bacterium]|nr:DUF3859 domain-containing protein [Marinilabiliaceae bacterium]
MKETPQYVQLFNELSEQPGCNTEKFTQLYQLIRTKSEMETEGDKVSNQKHFFIILNRVIGQLPRYYDSLHELVEQDTYAEDFRAKLLNHLDDHYGPDNIHRLVLDFDTPQTLKDAFDKMYNNLFDQKKRYQITHLYGDDTDFLFDNSLMDPGEGIHYFFEEKQKDGSYISYQNDEKTELKLFDALVANDQWREEVVEYLRLINAIHYSLGSEDDMRYPDQRIVFESPIQALLKYSSQYIPLLCDCYAVYDKWHDVSAMRIAYEMLPNLHPDADEMIYLYAAAYGRALGNYELIDTFEDKILRKLDEPDFRQRFIRILAADDVAASIAISYERRHLRGEDLRDELDLRYWDEDFEENRLGKYLKHVCSKEEYDELEELYTNTMDEAIDEPECAIINVLPPDLAEITGVKLNDRGEEEQEVTPAASVIFNTDQATFWKFRDKDFLIACDEGWIRLIDFQDRKQFTVRELTTDEETVIHLLTTKNAHDKSPVHFVTYSNGLIQGWHMASAKDKFRIRANVDKLFLSADGSRLAFIVDAENDYQEIPITDGKKIDIDLRYEKAGTFICFDVASLTEISRWMLNTESYVDPAFTPDGKYLFTVNGEEDEIGNNDLLQRDVMTGEVVKSHSGIGDYGIMNIDITPDEKKLIADKRMFSLPEMDFITNLQTYDFGKPFISSNSQMMAMQGGTASTEFSFAFTSLENGQYEGAIYFEEDSHGGDIGFFSPCGNWFCSILNDDLHIWDLKAILAKTPNEELEKFEIDFPTVGVLMMDGPFIHRIEQAKSNFINETQKIQFQQLEHGEFMANISPAQACEGREKQTFSDVVLLRECNALVPQPGTIMGVKLLPMAKGLQQFCDVKVKISFPERQDSETGENISSIQWYQEINHNEPVFIGWQFKDEQEFKPGTWMIEVSNMEDSTYLFRKIFAVERPFTKVDYKIHKTFCGLYSDESLPQTPVSESRTIMGKPGISFGLKFKFECEDLEAPYKLEGEMEHPPFHNLSTGELTTLTTRKFKLNNGNGIGFFQRFSNEEEVTEGKWIFRIKDPALNTVIMEEELEIVSPDSVGEPEFELIDSGLYTSDEKFRLFANYPTAEKLELANSDDTLTLDEGMVFGCKCHFKNLLGSKRLAAMVYHPPIKSLFGEDTEEDFSFDLTDDQALFIGWVMDRTKSMVEGEWTIKVWEDEVDEEETPVFEKSFILKNGSSE